MSKAEDLFNRWYYLQELTNEEILELQQDIRDFFASDEPEEDKKKLGEYMENFTMICNAIKEGYLENRKPSKLETPKKRMTFEPFKVPEFLKRKGKENTENKNRKV